MVHFPVHAFRRVSEDFVERVDKRSHACINWLFFVATKVVAPAGK